MSRWIAFVVAIAMSFWAGYWLGGFGGEVAEFRDRLSWTGFFIGVTVAFPIAFLLGGIAEHARASRLSAPWRQFEEMRTQLDSLERHWRKSGDEFERVQRELVQRKSTDDAASGTTGREG